MNTLSMLPIPLLQWYREHARDLPWRRTPDPYRVWVSEIMLQQTRVAAVLGYFARFMAAFPTIQDLADAPEDVLMKQWQGLGYYSRARNLQKAARQIMDEHGGVFPTDYPAIRALAGIGDYTAAAIASICFGQPVPAVDGNLLRVAARVLADDTDITTTQGKRHFTQALQAVIPVDFPGQFNQAMMDLGAAVCLPKNPNCESCPAASLCAAKAAGLQSRLPVREKNTAKPEKDLTVFLLTTPDGRTALRRRPETGLLSGLWEFPNTAGELTETLAAQQLRDWGLTPLSWEKRFSDRHIFTHLRWNMTVFRLTVAGDGPPDWVWASDDRDLYPMPTAFKKLENK